MATATELLYRLTDFAIEKGLIVPIDRAYAINRLLEIMQMDAPEEIEIAPCAAPETATRYLDELCNIACENGVIADSAERRDLFSARLMGALTPSPAEIRARFHRLYAEKGPAASTDDFYQLCRANDYIRVDRIARNARFFEDTPCGRLEITINLSKPEKDPKAIAAAKNMPAASYPKCLLCRENEGYAGRVNHPARQNHRIIPVTINDSAWFMQYSPYVYYNEHCIVFNSQHTPMKIEPATFRKLLDFVKQFPHYFVGSNADLPIVGGSILAHDHFQGGHYTFAMEKAPIETPLTFDGFDNVEAGIVKWPMSVIRLRSSDDNALVELGAKILAAWRGYTDEAAFIFAETDGEPHNTITPIARMRDRKYELDLVLRNNITTEEHPLGVYHPHAELHHIKKENIGLIEVMGLAVLPARLKEELQVLADALVSGGNIRADERISKHADWAEELKTRYTFTADNVMDIVQKEVGIAFSKVLEHAGVFKRDEAGHAAFLRFISSIG